jgi:hypothetical protein
MKKGVRIVCGFSVSPCLRVLLLLPSAHRSLMRRGANRGDRVIVLLPK